MDDDKLAEQRTALDAAQHEVNAALIARMGALEGQVQALVDLVVLQIEEMARVITHQGRLLREVEAVLDPLRQLLQGEGTDVAHDALRRFLDEHDGE